MGLESLGDLEYTIILSNLGPDDTARASCVNKKLRAYASEDSRWSHICAQDLGLSQPLDPLGNPVPSFKVFYFLFFYFPLSRSLSYLLYFTDMNRANEQNPCLIFLLLLVEFMLNWVYCYKCSSGQIV